MDFSASAQPFYWAARKAWYVKVVEDGKRKNLLLGKTKAAAMIKLDQLKAAKAKQDAMDANDLLFIQIADQWAVEMQRRAKTGTVSEAFVSTRIPHLRKFLKHGDVRNLYCSEITPSLLRSFLNQSGWKAGMERTVGITVKQVLNWGVRQKLILSHHLVGFQLPKQAAREFTVSDSLHASIMAKVSQRISFFIEALRLTGCRPGELRAVQLKHIAPDFGSFTLRTHKNSRKTGKPRTVFLTKAAQQIFAASIGEREKESDFVFINRDGKPLSNNAIRCVFKRLRESLKLGDDQPLVAYSYRHTWATNALLKGIPIATVAELMGSSVRMIEKHYGHLAKQPDHLRDAMERANQRTA